MPAGITSTASRPKTPATRPAPLLLDIWAAGGRRADGAADDAGDRDQRQDVRQGLEERPPLVAVRGREPVGERAREAEEERRHVRREWPPLAEDECSEADEPGAGRHVLVERVHEAEREVRAAHRRDRAGSDDRDVPDLEHGDADRVRRARMLADRPQPQTIRRAEDEEVRRDEQY